ncbi:MAG: hypothetical protein SGI97_04630 [candidate division Zixibacteria bacterium]|mgnify:CR=1 FL=1|nr:hypothetical protein [candidate division Zixibacteria bacterium]
MKRFILLVLILAYLPVQANDQDLSIERQREIIEDYLFVKGGRSLPSKSAAEFIEEHEYNGLPIKCGMTAAADFSLNRSKLDKQLLLSLGGDALQSRPILDTSYVSPSGLFLIHYTKTGTDAVFQANVDSDGDGHPNYVEMVGVIADSVYNSIVNVMGYPAPPADSFYLSGGDEKYDIYLTDLGTGIFGLAYIDSTYIGNPITLSATSFIELENDFQQIDRYKDRPLDAVRVTLAHEYFHAIQFGIDHTEADVVNQQVKRYWMEMSAVWMEEQLYDHINDYYSYLPYFFEDPQSSLQRFIGFADFHPYGAAIFPLYLSEKFDPALIREIWLRCGTLGFGGQVFTAINQILANPMYGSSLSGAFNEFWLWNYFTGQYTETAPNGIGYEEAVAYPIIPLTEMARHTSYPFNVVFGNPYQPHHNASTFIRLEELQSRTYDRFRCDSTDSGVCVDSSEIQILGFVLSSLPQPWVLSVVYQLEALPDSHFVETSPVPGLSGVLEFLNPDLYRSISLIFTTGTTNASLYSQATELGISYTTGGTDSSEVNPALISRPAAVLTPYPNPAVVSKMGGENLKFRFAVPTDSITIPVFSSPLLLVDLFTVSGEFVQALEGTFAGEDRLGLYRAGLFESEWNMKNQSGSPVSSGVYFAYARLYSSPDKKTLLAEDKVKVAIIR